MKIDLNQREVAELRRGLDARRKNAERRKTNNINKQGVVSSLVMELTSIQELDTKLAVAIANDLQNGDGK